MSDTDIKEKEEQGVLDDLEKDFSPEEQAEFDALAENDPGFYKPEDKQIKGKGRFGKKTKWGIGLGGGLTVAGLVVFLFLAPVLKLESYLNRVNQRAFTYMASAVEARAEHLFDKYMIARIITLQECGSQITINCRSNFGSSSIASRLFSTWQDVRIEEKIFDRLGFEVTTERNPNSAQGRHRYTLRDGRGQTIQFSNVEDWETFKRGQNNDGARVLGTKMRRIIREETKWYEVMQRRSMRKYLERKHGMRLWCFFACQQRDSFEGKWADAKTRFKSHFVERFVYPFSTKYGFLLNCITDNGSCNPDDPKNRPDRSGVSDEALERIAEQFGDGRSNPNFTQYVLEELITKITTREMAKKAVGYIPIAGQIYLGIWGFNLANSIDEKLDNKELSQMASDLNAAQYLEFYAVMRAANDEIKSGAQSLDEVAAINDSFDGAEQSLVYQAHIPDPQVASIFNSTVSAQSSTDSDEPYICDNGQPIPEGELVCAEKKVHRTFAIEEYRANKFVDASLGRLFRVYRSSGAKAVVQAVIGTVDKVSESIVTPIFNGLKTIAQAIPGVGQIISLMESKMAEFMHYVFNIVFPLPLSVDSPGRELLDGLYAGGEVAAAQVGRGEYIDGEPYGMGGKLLSTTEAAAIQEQQLTQRQTEYANMGWYDKMTDLENPRSLATQTVLAAPNSPQEGFASILSNLFNLPSLLQNFASPQTAEAFLGPVESPFGVPRYGYPLNSPDFSTDPDLYTDEYCQQIEQQWEASKQVNPETGFKEYTTTNPCLLEHMVVDSLEAYYTDE